MRFFDQIIIIVQFQRDYVLAEVACEKLVPALEWNCILKCLV